MPLWIHPRVRCSKGHKNLLSFPTLPPLGRREDSVLFPQVHSSPFTFVNTDAQCVWGGTSSTFILEKMLKRCFDSALGAKMLLTFSRHSILKIHLMSYFTGFSVLNLFSVFFSGMSIAHSAGFHLSFGLVCNS